MARARDWDKVRRLDRVYDHGALPHWQDGWSAMPPLPGDKPTVTIRDGRPESHPEKVELEADEWDLLSVDFGGRFLPIPMPDLIREDGRPLPAHVFNASGVTYRCPGIDPQIRSELLKKAFGDPESPEDARTAIRVIGGFSYARRYVVMGRHLIFELATPKNSPRGFAA